MRRNLLPIPTEKTEISIISTGLLTKYSIGKIPGFPKTSFIFMEIRIIFFP